ncbi:hypothetical protein [Stenotrophomonas sp.]|uniref:hypothetical protein n=1 Tax=Stenotrophomonas sp. TaxID=69392 RepID=UPI00289AAEDE|nr:hypothetical protein [Stenotrophomonas sp.]
MSDVALPRKPIDELVPSDLLAFPIWQFVSDAGDQELGQDEDETWVTPLEQSSVPLGRLSLSVATGFVTSAGRELVGILQVNTEDGASVGHAALLVEGEYLFLPSAEYIDAEADYVALAESLGLSRADVFPVEWTLAVPVEGSDSVLTGRFVG